MSWSDIKGINMSCYGTPSGSVSKVILGVSVGGTLEMVDPEM